MPALALLATLATGLTLGLVGAGGSVLATPTLVYLAGVAPAEAVGMSLAIVALTSLVAALLHARSGGIDWPSAALFAPGGAAGALAGAQLTHRVEPDLLLALFGVLLIAIGVMMLARIGPRVAALTAARRPGRAHPGAVLATGAAVGLLTGFLGIGGGFLIVPALLILGRLDMRRAIGTSLAVIAASSTAGLIGHLGRDHIDLPLTALFAAVAAAGAVAGHALARRAPSERLQRGFAGLVLLVGGAVAAGALGLLPF